MSTLKASPHYSDAVVFLAALHNTLPEIVDRACGDMDSDIGRQITHEVEVAENFAEAIMGRKCAECKKA